MTQVYVDLDGVLADFDAHYLATFGVVADKSTDNVEWARVHATPGFYRDMPLMKDAEELWSFVNGLTRKPIILTGVPKSVPAAADEKRAWVKQHLGPKVQVMTGPSRDKCHVCLPGDVLIDDWEKYREFWLRAGGRWITHTSADTSIEQLLELGIGF